MADSWLNYQPLATDGTDFWATFMTNGGVKAADSGLEISFIIVSHSSSDVTVTIENPNKGWSQKVQVAPRGTQYVKLPTAAEAYNEQSENEDTRGLHITSTGLISLYAANKGNNSYDATLVVPTSVLSRKYMVQTYAQDRDATEFAIVATQNNTQVYITPTDTTVNSSNTNTFSHLPRELISVTLRRGQTYQVRSYRPSGCLSGTTICATKPVAVFNGDQSGIVPYDENLSDDHLVEQALPYKYWGREFPISASSTQDFNYFRVTALQDGTVVRRNGTIVATINSGQTYEDSIVTPDNSCYVETSKRAICYNYLSSSRQNYINYSRTGMGDPSMVMILPPEQYSPNVTYGTFQTQGITPTHYVNVVCEKKYRGQILSDGTAIPNMQFKPVQGSGDKYYFATLQISHGAHVLSGGRFTAYVYGMGKAESYAYCAGYYNLPVDYYMLINGERINEYSQCINKGAINFSAAGFGFDEGDYESIKWLWGDGTQTEQSQPTPTAHTYTEAGTYNVRLLVTHEGCVGTGIPASAGSLVDTVRATIKIMDRYEKSLKAKKCEGDVVTLKGKDENGNVVTKTYTTDTKIDEHFYTVDGCDSIVHVDIKFGKPVTKTIPETACESYTWHGTTYKTSGSYSWTGKTEYGCDSVVNLNLTILHSVTGPTESKTICKGSSFTWNGKTISEEGTYEAKLTAANGCDSLCKIVVKVESSYKEENTVYICPNDSYEWRGQVLTSAKTYTETKKSATSDCDSTFILHLLHYENYNQSFNKDICEGTSYTLGDTILSTTGVYTRKLTSSHGCDSIVTIHLTVHEAETEDLYETICANETFLFNGENLNKSGTYTMTTQTVYGCGKTTTLHLTVNPVAELREHKTICYRDLPFEYSPGKFANKSDDYQVTFPKGSYLGCDSIYYLHLDVIEAKETVLDDVYRCDYEGAYSHPNADAIELHNLHSTGVYSSTLQSASGCDSIIILHFYWGTRTYYNLNKRVCEGDLPWKDPNSGLLLYRDTVYNDTIPNSLHCDSVITVNFSVAHAYTETIDTIVCEMELPFNYPDARFSQFQDLRTSGVYRQSIPTVDGCDSTIILNLTVNPTTFKYMSVTECESNLPYTYGEHNKKAYKTGEYRDTLISKNQYGCDSVLVVNLTVLSTIIDVQYEEICSVDLPYNHPDARAVDLQGLTQTGLYKQTLKSVNDCDSIIELHLSVWDTYAKPVDTTRVEICDNETYLFYGTTYNSNGEWVSGDYSSVRHVLTYTEQSIHGCDSAVAHVVLVHPTFKFTESVTVCQNREDPDWEWVDKDGNSHGLYKIDEDGDFEFLIPNKTIHQCDSVYGLTLHVLPTYYFDSVYSICENERTNWQGHGFSGISNSSIEMGDDILSPGQYHYVEPFTTERGCDSVFNLTLNVYPIFEETVEMDICENELPYTFTSKDYLGNYTHTFSLSPTDVFRKLSETEKDTLVRTVDVHLRTIHGCDSLVHYHITIHPSYEYVESAQICWDEYYEWRGDFYNTTGVYFDSLQTEKWGCDSVYVLELYVKPILIIPVDTFTCDNQPVYQIDTLWYNEDHWTETETMVWKPGMDENRPYYDVRFKGKDGCDSIIYRYTLEIYPTYLYDYESIGCSGTIGDLEEHIFVGIDTVFDVDQYILPWDTIVTDSLLSIHNCDSIYRLKAHIYPQYFHVDYDTICDNEMTMWRTHEYANLSAGDYVYQDKYITEDGCDSIYELRLCVHPTYFFVYNESICADEFYDFNGKQLNTSGFYYDSLYSSFGCDSVLYLYLTVLDTTYEVIYDTICQTDTFVLHGRFYVERGFYKDTTINQWGCHHFTYLYLEVIPPTYYEFEIYPICADEDILLGYKYDGREPLTFSVYFDSLARSAGLQDLRYIPLDRVNKEFVIPVPRGESLPHPNPTYFDSGKDFLGYTQEDKYAYVRPDTYRARIVMHNGVCSERLSSKDTIFDILYPSWIHEQHWNDGIILFNENYNGGYEWTHYQWYHNGQPIVGQVREYLYLPDTLFLNDNAGSHDHAYYVALTRSDDGHTNYTCPIYPILLEDTIVPRDYYFSVVPTLVVAQNPVVWILTTLSGDYYIYSIQGVLLRHGVFVSDDNNYGGAVTLPVTAEGAVIMKLVAETGEQRSFKILIQP